MSKVVTRIAPSPTGEMHIGTARTALFNYLYAKKHGGEFIVRIEDTDKERSKKEYEESILESLDWLGIKHDKLYRQSERVGEHTKYLQKLIDSGDAYISKEESKAEPGKEVDIIRMKNPNKVVTFTDAIRGEISVDTTDLGDFVIAKGMDEPLHHLAVVVDDHDMGVTHVIRGEDLTSNTPRQMLIQEALGIETPIYAHLPLILAPDRSKLSKRTGTAKSAMEYRDQGYLPEALINFLALIGWNPGGDQEIFTMDELIEKFSLEQINKAGAIFDGEKLNWMNGEYLKKLDRSVVRDMISKLTISDELKEIFKNEAALSDILERVNTINEIENEDLSYYTETPDYDTEKLVWKGSTTYQTIEYLEGIISLLEDIKEFESEKIKEGIWEYATEKGRGAVLWPMRYALSGRDKSPAPFLLAEILGKEETLVRLRNVVQLLHA